MAVNESYARLAEQRRAAREAAQARRDAEREAKKTARESRMTERVCPECGAVFRTSTTRRYCSGDCYAAAARRREKEVYRNPSHIRFSLPACPFESGDITPEAGWVE